MTSRDGMTDAELMPNKDGNENPNDTTTLNIIAAHETALSELAATISGHNGHPEGISPARSEDGEEQALEVHEVIELQAYDERKWITEQVKFLNSLPPIDIFASLDQISIAKAPLPGLPTEEQLAHWVQQHDRIDAEARILEKGKLRKLKKVTAAVSNRSLSRQDTDLIELALETIFEFDKLIHLLRERAENLDLLGTRLVWEARRSGAWASLSSLSNDLDQYIKRARWSPSVYDDLPPDFMPQSSSEQVIHRRGSTASIASFASDSSLSAHNLSRIGRFKLAEAISKDAARLSARINALRSGDILAADKALGKLIDKRKVPNSLLDEQDLLELKGLTELENVGKYLMSLAIQWKKADEFYAETMKDAATARTLMDEMDMALLSHPSTRQAITFSSKTVALQKRIAGRSDPSVLFLRPSHPRFPDQSIANDELVSTLSQERSTALDLVSKAQALMQEYQNAAEAVKAVEGLHGQTKDLITQLQSIQQQIEEGFPNVHGDGAAPDLSSVACLEPERYAAYLTMVPSVVTEVAKLSTDTAQLCSQADSALLHLPQDGVEPSFRSEVVATILRLSQLSEQVVSAHARALNSISLLRQARSIWETAQDEVGRLESIRREIVTGITQDRWKRQAIIGVAPPTPDSVVEELDLDAHPSEDTSPSERLAEAERACQKSVLAPARSLASQIGTQLSSFLIDSGETINQWVTTLMRMQHDWSNVKAQAAAMSSFVAESSVLQTRLEDAILRLDQDIDSTLRHEAIEDANDSHDWDSSYNTLCERLSSQVPMVSNATGKRSNSIPTLEHLNVDALRRSVTFTPSLQLEAIDDDVRTDSNVHIMRLSGVRRTLKEKQQCLSLARLAQSVDMLIAGIEDMTKTATGTLGTISVGMSSVETNDTVGHLTVLIEQLNDDAAELKQCIGRSFSPIRALLHEMEAHPASHHPHMREVAITQRRTHADQAEKTFQDWTENVTIVRDTLIRARALEETRRAQEEEARRQQMAEEEKRKAEDAERMRAMEEAERLRLEVEARLKAEEEVRKERARADELLRLKAEEEARRMLVEEERSKAEAMSLRLKEIEQAEAESHRLRELEKVEAKRARETEEAEVRRLEEIKAAESRCREDEARQQAEENTRLAEESQHQEEDAKLLRIAEEAQIKAQEDVGDLSVIEEDQDDSAEQAIDGHSLSEYLTFPAIEDTDVFTSPPVQESSPEHRQLRARIVQLETALRSLNISHAMSSHSGAGTLPSADLHRNLDEKFKPLAVSADDLLANMCDTSVLSLLRSLQADFNSTKIQLLRMKELADLASAIQPCDTALSDMLDHIDAYPALPTELAPSAYIPPLDVPPEDQMMARLAHVGAMITSMEHIYRIVRDSAVANAEYERVTQTWGELQAMAKELLLGTYSRSPSVNSSVGPSNNSSRVSLDFVQQDNQPFKATPPTKPRHFAQLSVSSSKRGGLLSPNAPPLPRRSPSVSAQTGNRSLSRQSVVSSNRSVSGPMPGASSSRLTQSTFASRQRTTSVSSVSSTAPPRTTPTPQRSRASTNGHLRPMSPSMSRLSSGSRTTSNFAGPRSSTSHSINRPKNKSSWSRAPRVSATDSPGRSKRKPYVANPKNKLDVAVGEVVNNLPVNIGISAAEETWKDLSGKYWIGNQDPKLCFCRILRSQMVMVRVGGGWTELSKFIKEHFAEQFRLLEDSPSRNHNASHDEKWINSSMLKELSPPPEPQAPPKTPEPQLPLFALSTPSRSSLRSPPQSQSPGSPLTALQFMRRMEMRDSVQVRPSTPTRTARSGSKAPIATSNHTSSLPAWRP